MVRKLENKKWAIGGVVGEKSCHQRSRIECHVMTHGAAVWTLHCVMCSGPVTAIGQHVRRRDTLCAYRFGTASWKKNTRFWVSGDEKRVAVLVRDTHVHPLLHHAFEQALRCKPQEPVCSLQGVDRDKAGPGQAFACVSRARKCNVTALAAPRRINVTAGCGCNPLATCAIAGARCHTRKTPIIVAAVQYMECVCHCCHPSGTMSAVIGARRRSYVGRTFSIEIKSPSSKRTRFPARGRAPQLHKVVHNSSAHPP